MSAGMPPPPDFLKMALAAREDRRRAEEQRLQMLQMQQQQEDKDFNLALSLAEQKVPLNTILMNTRLPANRAELLKTIIKTMKDREAQTEGDATAAGAQQTLDALIGIARGNLSNIPPQLIDQLKLQRMQGGDSSPEAWLQQRVALAQWRREKTTTLKAISGVLYTELGEVTDGSIEFDGMRRWKSPGRDCSDGNCPGDGRPPHV